jgi:hypothetical protein
MARLERSVRGCRIGIDSASRVATCDSGRIADRSFAKV